MRTQRTAHVRFGSILSKKDSSRSTALYPGGVESANGSYGAMTIRHACSAGIRFYPLTAHQLQERLFRQYRSTRDQSRHGIWASSWSAAPSRPDVTEHSRDGGSLTSHAQLPFEVDRASCTDSRLGVTGVSATYTECSNDGCLRKKLRLLCPGIALIERN